MAFLHGERRQTVMFPAIIDEYVATDDPVRAKLPFGHLKWNLGVQSFLLRGSSGVRAEHRLPVGHTGSHLLPNLHG